MIKPRHDSVVDILKSLEDGILRQQQQYRSLLGITESAIFVLSSHHEIMEWNRKAEAIFGFKRQEVLGKDYVATFIPKDIQNNVIDDLRKVLSGRFSGNVETPIMTCDGHQRVLLWTGTRILDADKQVLGINVIGQDVTDRRRIEGWLKGRNIVLEHLATGRPIGEVLTALAATAEKITPGMRCTILLLDQNERCLHHGAAPSMPEFYIQAINGLKIGPHVGSCGTAAYTGKRVVVEDVMTHPYWEPFRELAQQCGFRACWSEPILSSKKAVLGTLAMYYDVPRQPTREELEIIRTTAHVAGIAIERKIAEEAVLQANRELEQRIEERTRDLQAEINERKRAEEENQRILNHLNQHVKELQCLHTIEEICRKDSLSLPEGLQDIAVLVPMALQYPESACCRIVFRGQAYSSSNFQESRWMCRAPIFVNKEKKGLIEVGYLRTESVKDQLNFLPEERSFLEGIAKRLGLFIEKKLTEENLQATQGELMKLSQQIMHLQEEERKKIAREIHDNLGQSLVTLKMFIQSTLAQPQMKKSWAQECCQQFVQHLDNIIEKTQSLAYALRPTNLEVLGLSSAIRSLIEEFRCHQGLTIDFQSPRSSDFSLQGDAINLYRIVQEALTNIVKHAQASEVSIQMSRKNSHLYLAIHDNGRGFSLPDQAHAPDQNVSGGLGLVTMKERARLLEGELLLRSRPGQGTTIEVRLPLDTEGRASV